ncbi:DNA polymerase III, subunit gamma and tau [Candidatus Shapirobacteria bacterium CG10_big_fil_rev_8_21_14_0_10_40_9]|uniref:DNA polymerase III subunit gamma/tau n=1 Tax=Candidatus Shapirobacteria bacterium CG10_big_fil_rev_8_21_14_0_10_40_9 TaxID=1974888 RepID=A0A2M8L3X3_9BACT|nr:MAG: DNA polymerase III, subunit gamma and tau [Candidatus Shapirobacteria bacterium CG10_big_fil_rev_8_21_14_0_10_40_9]
MSDYTTKYRPQKISELDLTSIREGLEKVLKSGKIPHAFLFCGPRGTGKTSAARIIAKAVNCLGKKKDFEPCNSCDQCLSITAGTNLDVLEIDAASNRGIDDIRSLREKIKLAPSGAKYKIYIIDEAHMLTLEAFNALLKTLEEPPAHAIFILCTTAPEKLPETIISRCLRFNFKRATQREIKEKLLKIKVVENIQVGDEAVVEIAKAATGSFRDATKILEQASFAGGEITVEQIKELLGQTVGLVPEKLLEFLAAKDIKRGISEIGRVVETGGNLRVYTEGLLEILRTALLEKLGVSEWEIENTEGTENLLKALKIEEIKALIEIFSKAAQELREAIIPQLPLELAVVEWCGLQTRLSPKATPALGDSARPSDSTLSHSGLPQTTEVFAESQPSPRFKNDRSVSLEEIQIRWKEVLLAVRPRNHSVEALLRATRPINLAGGVLTLEVFYKFHKDQLETEKCRKIVEEVASEFLGSQIHLKCILGERTRTTEVTEKKEEYTEKPVEPVVPGNGETTDEDIVEVAKEIFSGIVE